VKLVKSVFRYEHGENIKDPAETYVESFNAVLKMVDPKIAEALDHFAEQIINIRLKQDNVFTEGPETGAMYHNRGRWDSGIVEKRDYHGV